MGSTQSTWELRIGCRLEIMAEKKAKEVNIVDQNAIWRETIRKENRCQKLYTEYHINPYKKTDQLTGKPNSHHDTAEGEEDKDFLHIIHKIHVEPRRKYKEPITESQEYGWYSEPLLKDSWKDRRLRFAMINTEITKFKDAEWKMKEQMNMK